MAMTRAKDRGQATTEAALGILVIATVIGFGIHFSEVAMLSLKVQEAGTAALWDATAKQMHVLTTGTPNFGPRGTAVQEAETGANTRYADFDGRASHPGNVSPTLVFTNATNIQVHCSEDRSVAPMDLSAAPEIGAMFVEGEGGMTCYAESDFSLVGFTRRFLQDQPFREQNASVTAYHICSMGRANNGGRCQAVAAIALGDWGLVNGIESANCELVAPGATAATCQNAGYYDMTKRTFDAMHGAASSGAPAGDQLSRFLWNTPHGGPDIDLDEGAFFMAAVGEDGSTPGPYQEGLVEHQGAGPYTVTPGGPYDNAALQSYPQAAKQRDTCAFGLTCNMQDQNAWPQYQ
jgi:hypothetical protein